KMNVVWHQAISVEIEREFGFLLVEQAGELQIIIVGPEYLSTIIPASDNVIEPPPISILGFLGMAGRLVNRDVTVEAR
ncbi:MAG TPA: hypothetical protein VLE20_15845, partial [Blastocatellia bacterium]|nr:hypothetical protein [Blastocatellia bacterium]